jgi:hypothetical protein
MQNAKQDLTARTKNFARRIIHLYVALPKETVAQVLGKQVLRSGTSVGANYREGIVSHKRLEPLLKETNELIAILVTISKRARGD